MADKMAGKQWALGVVSKIVLFTTLFGLLLHGCKGPSGDPNHIMIFDHEGQALAPTPFRRHLNASKRYRRIEYNAVDSYVSALMLNVERHIQKGRPPRVLLFLNGGLNGITSTIERANSLGCTILGDQQDGAYPIFIAWESGLWGSWYNDTCVVRRGTKNKVFGLLSGPLVLLQQLAVGIIHMPQNLLYYNPDTYLRGYYRYRPETIRSSQRVADKLARESTRSAGNNPYGDAIELVADPDKAKADNFLALWHVAAQPLHMLESVLLDPGGTAAWDEMDRRTRLLVDDERNTTAGSPDLPDPTPLRLLLAALADLQRRVPNLEVDLVCHSMGTIVGNRILQLDPSLAAATSPIPRFGNIVYMGAACAIGDFEASVYPYLERHDQTHMYHLTLHERMENRESNAWGFAPFGSLLTWIDSYYAHTRTPSDHALGRFTNLMNSYHRIPSGLRSQIHIRSFGLDDRPVVHGDFDDCQFWKRAFFVPDVNRGWQPHN